MCVCVSVCMRFFLASVLFFSSLEKWVFSGLLVLLNPANTCVYGARVLFVYILDKSLKCDIIFLFGRCRFKFFRIQEQIARWLNSFEGKIQTKSFAETTFTVKRLNRKKNCSKSMEIHCEFGK